jgi:hypothetical protein
LRIKRARALRQQQRARWRMLLARHAALGGDRLTRRSIAAAALGGACNCERIKRRRGVAAYGARRIGAATAAAKTAGVAFVAARGGRREYDAFCVAADRLAWRRQAARCGDIATSRTA